MLHVITHLLTLCCAHSINTHQNSRHSTLGLKLLKVEGQTRGTFFKEESKVIGYILVYIYIYIHTSMDHSRKHWLADGTGAQLPLSYPEEMSGIFV